MRHYAPNHMLAPQENMYRLSLLSLIGKSQKRDTTKLCMEFIQNSFRSPAPEIQTVPNTMILAPQVVKQIFVHYVPFS